MTARANRALKHLGKLIDSLAVAAACADLLGARALAIRVAAV